MSYRVKSGLSRLCVFETTRRNPAEQISILLAVVVDGVDVDAVVAVVAVHVVAPVLSLL